MINKKDILSASDRILTPFFTNERFQKVKPVIDLISYYTFKDEQVAYSMQSSTLKYDKYILEYGFSFGINSVVSILREIESKSPLFLNKYEVRDTFIGISPGGIIFPKHTSRAYKPFDDIFELELILNDVKVFYTDYFASFCAKYRDVAMLDKLFNRLDDFRRDNSCFPNLAFFHITRLVIARLANNPDYEKVVEKNFEALEYIWEQDGLKYDRFDESKPEVFAAKYLRDLKV